MSELEIVTAPVPDTVAGLAACDESDLEALIPWTGPMIDPATHLPLGPLPRPHVVATSGGWPKPGAEEIAGEINEVLIEYLWQRKGLLGATFAWSRKCWNSSRALSVWADEDALETFLTSKPHMNAVRRTNDLAYAWEGIRWTSQSRDLPTFDEVRARLADQRAAGKARPVNREKRA
ncbi:hypothetical protein [Actinokineospora sp.]|uniref:hypothetical protein n=1 Tax=Actinokineospora sp. TaxID=1872133 RepID=UPI00403820ED